MSGILYVVSAPSGAGKTSLVKALTAALPRLRVSVSYTTRAPRPGECDGVDYHFVSIAEFEQMLAQNGFMEYAQVFDHYYGTSWEWVLSELRQGTDVLLEIDWQGAHQIRAAYPECVTIFILPPSRDALASRLRGRGQDSETVIARRLRDALDDMRHYTDFDYVVINDHFDDAWQDLQAIVRCQGLRQNIQAQRQNKLLDSLFA
jgi:guanylate kinase